MDGAVAQRGLLGRVDANRLFDRHIHQLWVDDGDGVAVGHGLCVEVKHGHKGRYLIFVNAPCCGGRHFCESLKNPRLAPATSSPSASILHCENCLGCRKKDDKVSLSRSRPRAPKTESKLGRRLINVVERR
jgi:hypothetical protein